MYSPDLPLLVVIAWFTPLGGRILITSHLKQQCRILSRWPIDENDLALRTWNFHAVSKFGLGKPYCANVPLLCFVLYAYPSTSLIPAQRANFLSLCLSSTKIPLRSFLRCFHARSSCLINLTGSSIILCIVRIFFSAFSYSTAVDVKSFLLLLLSFIVLYVFIGVSDLVDDVIWCCKVAFVALAVSCSCTVLLADFVALLASWVRYVAIGVDDGVVFTPNEEKSLQKANETHRWKTKGSVYYILYILFHIWVIHYSVLLTSFCLQKVKELYRVSQ